MTITGTEVIRLTWGGLQTVVEAGRAIERRADIEISLPADLHHALCRRLHPDAQAAAPELVLDVAGGAELIPVLAGVAGLQSLAGLADPVLRAGYRLALRSPGPILLLVPPQMA